MADDSLPPCKGGIYAIYDLIGARKYVGSAVRLGNAGTPTSGRSIEART